MTSEVEICSNALRMLGANPIIALTDASTEARLCNGLYAGTRDDLIAQHPWNFCKRRVALAQLVDVPAFEYAVQYELPADCIGILKTWPEYVQYKIEGRRILSHSGGMKLLYKARIEDPDLFPVYFVTVLEYYLAARLAYPLIRSMQIERMRYEEYLMKLQSARMENDKEDSPDIGTPDMLTSVRLGG